MSGRGCQGTVVFQALVGICFMFSGSLSPHQTTVTDLSFKAMGLHYGWPTTSSRASHTGACIESPGKLGSVQIAEPHR